ncbi:tetratricopeptide repeat protein [Actinopolymorpha singaporensis]|uniref:tetratricopeptide repeat protein n=1 Tax=Actinopolymorpha singaporensis TaxID=117157 RepID=UPI000B81BB98
MYERALNINENAFGPNHPEVAYALTVGAQCCLADKPVQSRKMQERALTIYELAFGADHPKFAAALADLGAVSQRLGEHVSARDFILRALRIVRASEFPDQQLLADIIRQLRGCAPDLLVLDDGRMVRRRTEDDPGSNSASSASP